MIPRSLILACLPALAWTADHYEYHDLGILRPGELTAAEVSPPGTVLTGRNTSSTLIAWTGGPKRFIGSVTTTGAGAHEGFFTGTWTRGGSGPGGPGRALMWDMKTAAKVADIYLTSETDKIAVGNTDLSRTTVGVCEDVVITANVSMDSWFCVRGTLSSTGPGRAVTWRAPDYSDQTGVYAYKDGYARSIRFTVIAPSSVAYISKQDQNGQIPADHIGTRMSCEMVLQPTTVSFGNLFWFEEGGAAAAATSATGVFGYIAQRYGTPWNHNPSATDSPVTDANVVVGGDKVGWSFLVDKVTLAAFNSSNELKFRIPTKYVTPGYAKVAIETTRQDGRVAQTITLGTDAVGPFQTHAVTAYVEKKQQNNTNIKSFVTR